VRRRRDESRRLDNGLCTVAPRRNDKIERFPAGKVQAIEATASANIA
jgi:hypothetical protein